LFAFTEKSNRQYLIKSERKERHQLTLEFANKCDSLPIIKPINISDSLFSYLRQTSTNNDTITYWLTDTLAWQQDTIQVEATYQKREDSTYWQTDTISFIYRAPKTNKSKNKQNQIEENIHHSITTNKSNSFDIYVPLILSFNQPTTLTQNDSVGYILQEKVDTNWIDLPAEITKVDSIGLKYQVVHQWKPTTEYQLIIDSTLFTSFIGKTTNHETISFRTKSLEEYSILIIELTQHTGKEVIQILDKNDAIVKELQATDPKVRFEYMKPDTYYVRLFIDENSNGKWDAGNYRQHSQAEKVYYYPYDIELRAFWDVEEIWNYTELPILEQKPKELVKTEKK
jgi:hypothetical protein